MSSSEPKRRSPYQGLVPYSEADAQFFFGREKETRLVIANLFGAPLTLLYGASGVGKSSLLRAGVAHRLRDREDLLVVFFNSWQGNPIRDLKTGIADAAGRVKAGSFHRPDSISLAEYLASYSVTVNRHLMIMLDQFEEYFLYHPQDDEFAEEFPGAVTQTDAPISFLISIREDFYAKLDRFEGRISALYDNYLRVEHLERQAARAAIEKPIEQYNLLCETGEYFSIKAELVEAVLKQVETGRVILDEARLGVIEYAMPQEKRKTQIETPFLQLVMTRLWNEELATKSRELRLATLNRLGGAENIVRTHFDDVMSTLTPKEQDTAMTIFRYLVTSSGTKIAYNTSDLAAIAECNPVDVKKVTEKLSHGQVRVLRPLEPSSTRPGETRYEIFHDVLALAILDWRTRRFQAQFVSHTLEQSLGASNELDQEIAARIFPLLITSHRIRIVSTSEQLASDTDLPLNDIKRIVSKLSARNVEILRAVQNQEGAFEVSHDLFIEPLLNWLRRRSPVKVSHLGVAGTILVTTYFLLLALCLFYGLVCFWPSSHTGGTSRPVETVTFVFIRIFVSDDARFLIMTLLTGALGGLLRAYRSFSSYIGNVLLPTKRITYFATLPFVGAALAGIFYWALRGAFLSPATPASAFSPLSVAAMAGLIGLFSGEAVNKLVTVFETMFSVRSVKISATVLFVLANLTS